MELKSTIAALTLQYDFDSFTFTSVSTFTIARDHSSVPRPYFVPLTALIATGGTNIVKGSTPQSSVIDGNIYTQELRLEARRRELQMDGGPFFLHASQGGGKKPIPMPSSPSSAAITSST